MRLRDLAKCYTRVDLENVLILSGEQREERVKTEWIRESVKWDHKAA